MAEALTLLSPALRLEKSYHSFIDELSATGEERIPFVLAFPHEDFPALIERLQLAEQGVEIAL